VEAQWAPSQDTPWKRGILGKNKVRGDELQRQLGAKI
jgi:hypothetical protein